MDDRPSDEALLGSVLGGKYRVVGVLGRGGMATVYEAEHEGVELRFAVKVLAAKFAHDEGVSERFRNEAKAANGIVSPHVVTYVDVGTHEGVPYAVMERLMGEDLGARVRRERTVAFADVTAVAEQVLDALEEAHARGIVHRDLKPDNMFLVARDSPGAAPFVKLLDFGISKRMNDDTKLTRAGTVMGTAHYMAPEQVEAKTIDGRTDLYALAATMYECLTGRPPHVGETYESIVLSIATKDPPPLGRYREGVPAVLAHVVEKGLARDPADRFQSAAEMKAALRAPAPRRGPPRDIALIAALAGVLAAGAFYLATRDNDPVAVQRDRRENAPLTTAAPPPASATVTAPLTVTAVPVATGAPTSALPSAASSHGRVVPVPRPTATLGIDRTLP